jgi:hypothetical protein
MADQNQRRQTETADEVRDPSVWRALCYLDSSSDYREYLPRTDPPALLKETEFVTLDDKQSVWGKLWVVTLATISVCTILLLSLRS